MKAAKNESDRLALSAVAFGPRASAMTSLLKQGSTALRQQRNEIEALSDAAVKRAQDVDDVLDRLEKRWLPRWQSMQIGFADFAAGFIKDVNSLEIAIRRLVENPSWDALLRLLEKGGTIADYIPTFGPSAAPPLTGSRAAEIAAALHADKLAKDAERLQAVQARLYEIARELLRDDEANVYAKDRLQAEQGRLIRQERELLAAQRAGAAVARPVFPSATGADGMFPPLTEAAEEVESAATSLVTASDRVKEGAAALEEALRAGSEYSKSLRDVPAKWQALFLAAARRAGIDPNLLASIAWQESRFRPGAVSSAGARGLMQLMLGTAADLGVSNAFAPEQAVPAAAKYMAMLLDRYHGDPALALAAYNWGLANVDTWVAAGKHPAAMPAETRGYLGAILTPASPTSELLSGFQSDEAARQQANWDRYVTDMSASTDAMIAQMDALRDVSSDVFGGIISDLRAGASAGEVFANVLTRIGDAIAEMAVQQITAGLFGAAGTASPGLLGSLFAPLIPTRQGGGPMMPNVPYAVHQDEIVVPSVGSHAFTPQQAAGAMGVHVTSEVIPNPLFSQVITATTSQMIAANNRQLPGYLTDRKRRGM